MLCRRWLRRAVVRIRIRARSLKRGVARFGNERGLLGGGVPGVWREERRLTCSSAVRLGGVPYALEAAAEVTLQLRHAAPRGLMLRADPNRRSSQMYSDQNPSTIASPPDSPSRTQYLTVREVSRDLQFSEYTIRAWAKGGLLSGAVKKGRAWRFRAGEVAYIEPAAAAAAAAAAAPAPAATGRLGSWRSVRRKAAK